VTFGYSGDVPVLHDINLIIEPGLRVALVGPTGAGKSTLAKLAMRFYDPNRGRVLLDGVDLRDVSSAELRQAILMVPQEGFLFSGTVRENIKFGKPDASEEEIIAACRLLEVHELIEALPEGYDTEVSYRGSRLSVGERQLVSLARAFVADPPVLVLDEATSSLDPGTEQAIEQALRQLLAGRTSAIIAHRLSTAEQADRILVVEAGRIAEDGTHDQLVRAGGHYARLYRQWTYDPRKAVDVA
jgi:ATP-binding cassette subfamily B protein